MKVIDHSFKYRMNVLKRFQKKICSLYPGKQFLKKLYKTKNIKKCADLAKEKIEKENHPTLQTLIHVLFLEPYKIISYKNNKKNTEEWKEEWGKLNLKPISIRKLKKILKKENWDKIELQIYTCDWICGWWSTAIEIEK